MPLISTIEQVKGIVRVNADLTFPVIETFTIEAEYQLAAAVGGDCIAAEQIAGSMVYDLFCRYVVHTAMASFVIANQFTIGSAGNRGISTEDAAAPKLWEVEARRKQHERSADQALSLAIEEMVKDPSSHAAFATSAHGKACSGLIFKSANQFSQYHFINGSYKVFINLAAKVRQYQLSELYRLLGEALYTNLIAHVESNATDALLDRLAEASRLVIAPMAFADGIRSQMVSLDSIITETVIANSYNNTEAAQTQKILAAIDSANQSAAMARKALESFIRVNAESLPGYVSNQATGITNTEKPVFFL